MISSEASNNKVYDVVVIGGGPAGSTAGSWLAKAGRTVLLLEKERFPRFHIGESLLPNGNGILKEIGVWQKVVDAGFVEKYGAEFTVPDRTKSVRNVFADGIVPGMEQTYQVERARFDEILLRHSESLGCTVREATKVVSVERRDGEWLICTENLDTGESSCVASKWVIDASGRTSVMGRHLGLKKESIPYPGRFAVFNHFENVPRAEGKQGGDIIVTRLQDAWFWSIPISATVTSIGVVAQKGARSQSKESLKDFFWRKVTQSGYLAECMAKAVPQGEYKIESDYCFAFDQFGKERVLLAGDASSFIDPVFSSGVYLALESGLLAAKTIDLQLEEAGVEDSDTLYQTYTKTMKDRVAVMRQLIESYYDNDSFEVFMSPQPRFKLPNAVNSVLAGCSKLPFSVKWRFWLFKKICKIHKKKPLVDAIEWEQVR